MEEKRESQLSEDRLEVYMFRAGMGSVFRNGLERTWAVRQQSLLVILLFRVVILRRAAEGLLRPKQQ